MFGCLRSCVGKVVLLVLLAGVAYAGWRWGPEFFPRVQSWLDGSGEVEASPELAEATLDRYEAFQAGEEDRLSVGGAELASVLRFALPGLLPPGVSEPSVDLEEGRVRVSARVAVAQVPRLPDLDQVVGLLPDTVTLAMRGSLTPLDGKGAALVVEEITAARIPLPRRMIPDILNALGRTDRPGLPPDAMAVPLPEGLRSAYILRDSLILVADR